MLSSWLHLPPLFFLVFLLWRLHQGKAHGLLFWAGLAVKVVAGLALGYVYKEILGGGDTWSYHRVALKVLQETTQLPLDYVRFWLENQTGEALVAFRADSNSFFFIKLLSFLYLLTDASYWWSSAYLSLFSFWGCWYLFLRIEERFPDYRIPAFVAFLFFPSIVFWTSGVSKDSLVMGAMCFLFGFTVRLLYAQGVKEKLYYGVLFALASWLFWKVKFFLAVPAIVFLLAYLLVEFLAKRFGVLSSLSRKAMLWLGMMVLGAVSAYFLQSDFTPDDLGFHVMLNYNKISAKTSSELPQIVFPNLNASFTSILWHAPQAVGQMLVRPFIWEPAPLFYKLIAIENLVILFIILTALVEIIKNTKVKPPPAFWLVLLCFFLAGAVLVALPTPNLGSLNRYRAPLLAIFLTIALAQGPWLRWWHRLTKGGKSA
ncbi:hypothetical protein TH61_10410 [Rufibacter sp. DG15C]|uniref:hypothetical protein n=1 Tax=Rufibacter sp. DG15C TaxID=1379909 RepID=UPI00078DE119|nr:hypothetical protein [Rufibacter sp. DG15C]AMM51501.1 hypothetical protein TH61_10410 [Rufibacter sp. DG15C]